MSILNPFKKDKKGPTKSADEPAVEPPVSGGGAVPSIPRERQDRQRGPVEEVIAKRMRQLGKKLQRYRSYAAQSPESLNDDQRSAIKALPSLEGAYRELEELIRENGPVDEQELIQAAKLREATEAARSAAAQESSQGLESYKSSLVTPLSLFLRLHSLLHPARSADHEHLTFGHLTLPARLQDEVQATDVLRVGRMWEDLAAGGDAGKAVLEGLVSGPDSTDNDDEHVHHLLKLLSEPENQEVESEPAPIETAAAQADEPTESATVAPTEVIQPESIAASRAQSEYGQQESTDSTKPASTSGGVLNFLQDDELNNEQKEEKSLGESYEIVPRLEAHQTSGSQPPIPAETQTATTSEAPAAAPVTESVATQAPTQNWADLDDEDEVPQAASSDIPVLAQPIAVAEDSAGAPGQTGARGTGPRGRGRNNGPRPPRQGQQQKAQAESGEPTIDADGFEVKSGRKGLPPPPSSRGSFRGRGRGGPRGGGRPADERAASSNGPAGAEGQSAPSARGPRPPARGGSSFRGGRGGSQAAQAPVTEKKSIYKTVQPTGPTSAPIL